MPPQRWRRGRSSPPPELTPAQEQALRDVDVALGRLHCAESVSASLRRLGLAAQVGGEQARYLTLAGWTARDRLTSEVPPATTAGPFAAATGESVLTDREGHAEAARRAWQSTLELRRLTSEAMTIPAPLEQGRPVHSVALVLEAAGVAPADVDASGRCLHTGYQARLLAGAAAAARVEWKHVGSGPAAEEALAECREVLECRGWRAEQYRGAGRRPFLVVWPAGSNEPLL